MYTVNRIIGSLGRAVRLFPRRAFLFKCDYQINVVKAKFFFEALYAERYVLGVHQLDIYGDVTRKLRLRLIYGRGSEAAKTSSS